MEPFLGEIRAFSFGIIPKGWAGCNGQLLSVSQNSALFSLLGTQYGGDGRSTFGLPDLRGRVGINAGPQNIQGESAGVETVTLLSSNLPAHTHFANATTVEANAFSGRSGVFAASKDPTFPLYGSPTALVPIAPQTVGASGENLPHDNMQPYLVLNYCIALQGIYPSRG